MPRAERPDCKCGGGDGCRKDAHREGTACRSKAHQGAERGGMCRACAPQVTQEGPLCSPREMESDIAQAFRDAHDGMSQYTSDYSRKLNKTQYSR